MYHGTSRAARFSFRLSWFRFELHMIDLAGFSLRLSRRTGIDFHEIAPMLSAAKPRPRTERSTYFALSGDEHAWINCPLDPQRTAHRFGLADDRVFSVGQVTEKSRRSARSARSSGEASSPREYHYT